MTDSAPQANTQFNEWYKEIPGEKFYRCSWIVDDAKAVVIIAHGMGEHIGRYDGFARMLNSNGFNVYGLDHRGHGKSCITVDHGNMGAKGWQGCLSDLLELRARAVDENPSLAMFLFGHSMGAVLAQQFICSHGGGLDGVLLSGSPGFVSPFLAKLARFIARFESWRQGPAATSNVLQGLVFDGNNKAFAEERGTGFEWLSRDEAQVDAYVSDSACGFVLCNGSMAEFFSGALAGQDSKALASIPKELPVFILSGSADPVHDDTKNLRPLRLAYESLGLDVSYKLYLGGRHEMLNEANNDQVKADIVAWFNTKVP